MVFIHVEQDPKISHLKLEMGRKIKSYIVSLNVKMGEIDSNFPLRRGQNFPNAVFVRRIKVWK